MRPDARVLLVRHGRSAHRRSGWLDADGVRHWLVRYDAAGILPDDVPPTALRELASHADVVVASDLPRALASAERLAAGLPVLTSPLLREIPLPVPALGLTRLPLACWALAIGTGAAVRRLRGTAPPGDVRTQATAAAAWLSGLAERDGLVVAVTHANVRAQIAAALGDAGWRREPGGGRHAHWSAWSFVRPDGSPVPHHVPEGSR